MLIDDFYNLRNNYFYLIFFSKNFIYVQNINMAEKMTGGKKSKSPKDKKKPAAKKSGPKKTNPWLVHVKKTMKENPKLKFKDVLKLAKKTYKK